MEKGGVGADARDAANATAATGDDGLLPADRLMPGGGQGSKSGAATSSNVASVRGSKRGAHGEDNEGLGDMMSRLSVKGGGHGTNPTYMSTLGPVEMTTGASGAIAIASPGAAADGFVDTAGSPKHGGTAGHHAHGSLVTEASQALQALQSAAAANDQRAATSPRQNGGSERTRITSPELSKNSATSKKLLHSSVLASPDTAAGSGAAADDEIVEDEEEEEEEEEEESSEISASDEDGSWIAWFCSLRGNEFFCEVDEDYIQDDFNLTGLNGLVPYYDYALDMVLDVEMPMEDALTEDQQEIVESAAEMLYGLIHARYIVTNRGMHAMYEKYRSASFGRCPHVFCQGQPVLPVGLSDLPRNYTVNVFCPRCHGLFFPKSTRQANIDGAYFGTTFPHLYLMTHPDMIPVKPTQHYVPRVYGFKIHQSSLYFRNHEEGPDHRSEGGSRQSRKSKNRQGGGRK
uniref:Casein kinase II subunit beta n=1 Tax=Helicotheca tamesis TaxID=374047 RepID=A0A7S2MKI4_9STRA|mmetsp:Transcript_17407/g.23999  ORF Transcript_17407/g.23999 Transcript_17407/m.23999 type:complete len:460 (+) Transcript_17407:216-1595(+)|eukprot:CAMPEP_0185730204 /NCGR_PEP_ID=MMETSP1171-20130828/8856_1 /TAXON_ID=374046 /ORGANISM="Helicotheca tamensis, Strain CCMP826" /LENGTH=459 /DNA_ID=CAMNT_0028399207 /DNA_START=147 /DNA_END=1526 /DNA_ORIENTATION=-